MNDIQQNLQTLLQKEMSRREFLMTLGFGVASIFGFSSIIKLLAGYKTTDRNQQAGFGGGDYGNKAQ